MISHILHETVENLDRYLTSATFDDCYTGRRREEIIRFRDETLYIARVLNAKPGTRLSSKAQALAQIAEEQRQMPRAMA
jgi:hypothetical protein